MALKHFFILDLFLFSILHGQGQNSPSSDRYMDACKDYLSISCPVSPDSMRHFVYFARDRELIHDHPFLSISRLSGAQIMYSWRQLEPREGVYDFSIIEEDLSYLGKHGKKLFIQLQDATFSNKYHAVPDYLVSGYYDGGEIYQRNENGEPGGWVAKRWNSAVRNKFDLLLLALGKEFDGRIEGINLQESAIGVSQKYDSTFSPAVYTEALKSTMLAMKKAFSISVAMQYANFMPGEWLPGDDNGYLRSIYRYGDSIGVGLGAPDLMVQRKGQLNHALAMMHEGNFSAPLGIAVQDGNYIGETGNTRILNERKNLVPLLHAFAKDFLHVKYMFWANQDPYFTEDLIPCFISSHE